MQHGCNSRRVVGHSLAAPPREWSQIAPIAIDPADRGRADGPRGGTVVSRKPHNIGIFTMFPRIRPRIVHLLMTEGSFHGTPCRISRVGER